jgi:hypothetical protein
MRRKTLVLTLGLIILITGIFWRMVLPHWTVPAKQAQDTEQLKHEIANALVKFVSECCRRTVTVHDISITRLWFGPNGIWRAKADEETVQYFMSRDKNLFEPIFIGSIDSGYVTLTAYFTEPHFITDSTYILNRDKETFHPDTVDHSGWRKYQVPDQVTALRVDVNYKIGIFLIFSLVAIYIVVLIRQKRHRKADM